MRRLMVAGNWKMHGTRASVAELIKGLSNQALPSGVDVAVFPPCLYINQVIDGLNGKSIAVGAQMRSKPTLGSPVSARGMTANCSVAPTSYS